MKGKNLFFTFAVIVAISLLATVGLKIQQKDREKVYLETMPQFYFYDEKGSVVTHNEFDNDYTKVLVYFNSSCSLCQEEFHFINKSINEFVDTQFIFISTEEFDDIKLFALKNQLLNIERVVFLQDRDLKFSSFFKYDVVPSTFVYNSKGKLLEAIKGYTPINDIIQLTNGVDRK